MNKKIFAGVALVTALSIGLGTWYINKPTQEIKTTASDVKSFTVSDMAKIKNNQVYNNVGYKISFFTDYFSSAGVITSEKGLSNLTEITGLTSMTVEVTSGTVEIYGSYPRISQYGTYFDEVIEYASGTGTVVADFGSASPNYFKIKAVGGNATISSITINYNCTKKYHKMTTYFYTPFKPTNDVYMIIDDNGELSSVDIRGGELEKTPMTYIGQDAFGYHKYSYDYYSDFGLKEIIFVTHIGGEKVFVCDTSIGGGETIELGGNVTSYCYSYKGFPRDTSYIDTFFTYDYELDGSGNIETPCKTQFNITFAEGTADFNYVGIKTDLRQTDYHVYTDLEKTGDRTWSCSVLSVRLNYFNLYFEMTSNDFSGTAQLSWTADKWMRVNKVYDNTAVVNITISHVINSSGRYAISEETIAPTNCTLEATA